MRFSYPPALAGFIAVKGSVCMDGVSLTVNDVGDASDFGVNLIPHTLEVTTLGRASARQIPSIWRWTSSRVTSSVCCRNDARRTGSVPASAFW